MVMSLVEKTTLGKLDDPSMSKKCNSKSTLLKQISTFNPKVFLKQLLCMLK